MEAYAQSVLKQLCGVRLTQVRGMPLPEQRSRQVVAKTCAGNISSAYHPEVLQHVLLCMHEDIRCPDAPVAT